MIRSAALVASALAVATPAVAQQMPTKPVDEIVADLALGHCPMALAGQFPLAANPVLTGMGFPAVPKAERHARFGALQVVERADPQGNIRFSVAPGRVCQVVVDGPKRAIALSRLKRSMGMMAGMGIDFRPVPAPTGAAGLKVEAFKAAVAPGQALNLHLIEMSSPRPMLIAQLFGTGS